MNELWDIKQLSEYLRIKRSTLYTMVERKEIPFYRIGRLARFKQNEIDEWLTGKKCEIAETDKMSKKIFQKLQDPHTEAKKLVKAAIDDVKLKRYTLRGKSDPVKGLRKEVRNGII